MSNPSTSQSSTTNNKYVGCLFIPSTPQFEANKTSHLVCYYYKQAYKIISLSTHFNKCLAQLEKRGLDPSEMRQKSNKYQRKYWRMHKKDVMARLKDAEKRWKKEFQEGYPREPLFKDHFSIFHQPIHCIGMQTLNYHLMCYKINFGIKIATIWRKGSIVP